MALFDTVCEQLEIGPATVLDTGMTADSGNTGHTMVASEKQWDLFVRPGDLVYLAGNVRQSAYVINVDGPSQLTLSKPIATNSTSYAIVRPAEAFIRPHPLWEWEIHTIVATYRQDLGADINLFAYPLEVWSTNDNTPKTRLLTTEDHSWNLRTTKSHYELQFNFQNLLLKPTYHSWLLIRSYYPGRVDVLIQGIDKTIKREWAD